MKPGAKYADLCWAGLVRLGWRGHWRQYSLGSEMRWHQRKRTRRRCGHWTLDTGHWTLDCDLGKLASVRSHGQYGHGDVVDTQLQGPGSKLLLH